MENAYGIQPLETVHESKAVFCMTVDSNRDGHRSHLQLLLAIFFEWKGVIYLKYMFHMVISPTKTFTYLTVLRCLSKAVHGKGLSCEPRAHTWFFV